MHGYTEKTTERKEGGMARSLLRPGYLVPTHFHGIPFSLRKIKSPQNSRNCVLLGNGSDVNSQRESHSIGSHWVTKGPCSKACSSADYLELGTHKLKSLFRAGLGSPASPLRVPIRCSLCV